MSSPISPIPPPRRKSKSRRPIKEMKETTIQHQEHLCPQEPFVEKNGHSDSPDPNTLVQNPEILTEVELKKTQEEIHDKYIDDEGPAQMQIEEQSEKETAHAIKEETDKQPKDKQNEQIEELPTGQPKLQSEQQYEELPDEIPSVAKALESAEQNPVVEEVTLEQKSKVMLRKVLADVKKAKDDVKNRINKNEEKSKDISSLEKGKEPGETSTESEKQTNTEKIRRSMQGGLDWLKKIYGDAVACVDKTDKKNLFGKTQVEQSKNCISVESLPKQSNGEKEDLKQDCTEEMTEEIKNISSTPLTLDENVQQSAEIENKSLDESSSFKYCEESGEIRSTALVENSVQNGHNGSLSEETENPARESQAEYLLRYCETSGELKNMAVIENELEDNSGKFHKVLETVDQFLGGPTPEEREEVSSKFSATKVQNMFKLKVYWFLTCQLSIAIVFISIFFFLLSNDLKDQDWLLWLSLVISVSLTLPMLIIPSLRTNFPVNILILSILTIIESIMFGMITTLHDARAILVMFILTAGVIIIFAIFTLQKKAQYTNCNMMVTSLSFIITAYIMSMFATPLDWFLPLTHGSIVAFIFSVWVTWDINQMVQGSHIFISSPDQYVFASLSLQLFILHGFILILKIIRWTGDQLCAIRSQFIFGYR